MLDETRRLGLPAPQFREVNEFVVTFRKAPALVAPQTQPQYRETLWGGSGCPARDTGRESVRAAGALVDQGRGVRAEIRLHHQ